MIDFDEKGKWRHSVFDGYIATLVVTVAALCSSVFVYGTDCIARATPFIIVVLFAAAQLYRISRAFKGISFEGLTGNVPSLFAYSYAISTRRGLAEELHITRESKKDMEDEEGDKFDENKEWQKRSIWRRELIDTYRHMREHGNSAFIFLLEIALASLCFLVLAAFHNETAQHRLALIAVLFAIWAIPATLIHLTGQHIERRFSWYDRKAKAAKPE